MKKRKVKAIMLALSEYAIVDRNATLLDMLDKLEEAQQRVPPGRHPHRAVLVGDEKGNVVGKVGHMSFLKALLRCSGNKFEAHAQRLAQLGDAMVQEAVQHLRFFDMEADDDWVRKARHLRVKDVMLPADIQIEEDATLLDAVQMFVIHNTLSLIVIKGSRVTGVLRLADLFDELARDLRTDTD